MAIQQISGSQILTGTVSQNLTDLQSIPDYSAFGLAQTAAYNFVSFQRVIDQGIWTSTQTIDPLAPGSNTYTFGSGQNLLSVSNTSSVAPGASSFLKTFSLATDIGVGFTGRFQLDSTFSNQFGFNNHSVVSTEMSFSDNKNTIDISDDITAYVKLDSVADSVARMVLPTVMETNASGTMSSNQSYSGNGTTLSYLTNGNFAITQRNLNFTKYLLNSTENYSFTNSVTNFAVSFAGTKVTDQVGGTENISFSSFAWSTSQIHLSANNVPQINIQMIASPPPLNPNIIVAPFVDPINYGASSTDNLAGVQASMEQYLLPGALAADNVITAVSNSGIQISSYAGDDTVTGGSGNDTLVGGLGNDALNGAAGVDIATYSGAFADYTLAFDFINNRYSLTDNISGRDGIDTLQNIEFLQFTDVLYALPNTVVGTNLDDALIGTTGDDKIYGLAGNDSISGLAGNDTISGGVGRDTLTGGLGRDTFVFSAGDSGQTSATWDIITDFTKGLFGTGDLIDYSSDLTIGGSNARASVTQAQINQSTGVATFNLGSGTTIADAAGDIARRFTAATDSAGEFALFRINNTGSYYMFISDGLAGVGSNDVVIQLRGVSTIASINLAGGNLAINR